MPSEGGGGSATRAWASRPKPEWRSSSVRSSRWADSVLPPSPRTALATAGSGHVETSMLRPKINPKNVPNPPPSDVQPSDKQLSPRGWFFERPGASSGSSDKRTRTPGVSAMPSGDFDAAREYRRRARAQLAARNARREMDWNRTPHRTCPAMLVGIKPMTEEPWSRDAKVYAHKFGYKFGHSFEWMPNQQMDGGALDAYNDESVLDGNNGYEIKVTATGLSRANAGAAQPSWDSSTFRSCPFVLRGIKPVTREPWVFDERIYNRDTTRDTTDDERAGGGALDLGSSSHATRARNGQVDRPSFYSPNWEKWAASLSA